MIIIWGFRWLKKVFGPFGPYTCGNCHNTAGWMLTRATHWFTLFWIPIFPVGRKYLFTCPVCNRGHQLMKEEFKQLTEPQAATGYPAQGQPTYPAQAAYPPQAQATYSAPEQAAPQNFPTEGR